MDVTGYMSIMIWFSADVQKLDVWWNKTQRCFGKKKHVFFGSRSWIRKDVFAWYQWYSTRWESLYHRWVNLQVHTFFAFQACKAGWFCNGLKSIKKRAAFAQWLVLFAFAAFKEMMFNFYKKASKFDQLSEISGFFAAWSKHQIVTSTLNWHICFRFPMMLKIQLHPAVTVGYFKNPAISADDRCFNALQRSLEQRPPRTAMRCGILKVFEIHIRQTFQEAPVFSQL